MSLLLRPKQSRPQNARQTRLPALAPVRSLEVRERQNHPYLVVAGGRNNSTVASFFRLLYLYSTSHLPRASHQIPLAHRTRTRHTPRQSGTLRQLQRNPSSSSGTSARPRPRTPSLHASPREPGRPLHAALARCMGGYQSLLPARQIRGSHRGTVA